MYHIENYLLEPKYISVVINELSGGRTTMSEHEVTVALADCASQTVSSLIVHSLTQVVNKQLVDALSLRINPLTESVSKDLSEALEKSLIRVDTLITRSLSANSIENDVNSKKEELQTDLSNGNWKKAFRGRDILKRFVGQYGQSLKYELFRNLIVARMRDDEFCPEGMKKVLRAILAPAPIAPI